MEHRLSRRQVLRGSGTIVAGTGALWLAAGPSTAAAETPQAQNLPVRDRVDAGSVTVKDSANLGVSVSPDGRRLAVDIASGIWLLPTAGGRATRITPEAHDATRPHWSPDGRRIVFQSYLNATYDVWMINADGTGLTQLTTGWGFDLEPRFSPDGKQVAFSSDRDHVSRIYVLDIASGRQRAVTEADEVHASPVWSPDGTKLAYVVGDGVIEELDLPSGQRKQLLSDPALAYSPVYTPDGRISYVSAGAAATLMVGATAVVTGEDLPPLPVSWLSAQEFVYSSGGRLRRRTLSGAAQEIPFTAELPFAGRNYQRKRRDLLSDASRRAKGIADPVVSRDGKQVAFRALNALWVLPVGGRPRKVVDDGHFAADPDFAPDGQSLVYTSDRAGTANLWRLDLASGRSDRLTDLAGGQFSPRFSPDGTKIAYQDESGQTWVFDVAARSVRQVLPALYQPGRPTWSPDGGTIAMAALQPYSKRTSNGNNQVLTVNLASNELRYQEIAPDRSISTRDNDGPLWTADGQHLVFGAESLGWRVPVAADGTITGPPEQLTDEVTDSLSIGADGSVVYLCNGVLRTVGAAGGVARTITADLSYKPARVSQPTVIRAGALWDGACEQLRPNVDIVVRGATIEAVLPSGSAPSGARVVDASALTAMPGLIDTHNHWNMRGKQWGDRQGRLWLSYGVTTSKSPGDLAYQMVENREAMEAGTRVGPRYLGSGQALDGSRAFYNCMRPIHSAQQLERELDRAQGLDYDQLKSYMRLPVAFEQRVVARAHAMGVPVTSHYLYPAAHTGLDGMEHPGGGHRLNYSRTLSFAGYHMSQDAVDLLAATGMWVSSTMIFATELYAGDRSLVDDERTKVLFPDWDYQRLVAKADAAGQPGGEFDELVTKGMADALLRVHRAGGLVVFGTDAPLDDLGVSAHQNLRALVKYGFTPREALLTATGNAARALGYGDLLGAVAPGRIADLVLVQGNPLADIHAAAAVQSVMVGGVLRTVPELLAPFRPGPTAKASAVTVGPATASAAPDPAHYWHRPEWSMRTCCQH
ncbi:amidohydrolase family protein [Kutzneria sp. 744]|uniref:amidohydrolase family protein n=1 Tax=Kutzneria sp. (strain 744) TaxID=345341 RepID=UPI0003EEB12F|nr:amidohydrolase family protein [Kutzneria sp. 744]EWM12197.1 twin-arginine translocation pathway signal protein [Kutzneria sp. 744]